MDKIFIPICLYNNTVYNKKSNLKVLFNNYITHNNSALIVICDTLHAYNSIIMKKCYNYEDAEKKALNIGLILKNLVVKTYSKIDHFENIVICMWQDIANHQLFNELFINLQSVYKNESKFNRIINDFIRYHIEKYNWRTSQNEYEWELKYIISELTMSIYCTEILGYSTEIWEKKPNTEIEFLDPINYLYNNFDFIIKDLIKKKQLDRKLIIFNK